MADPRDLVFATFNLLNLQVPGGVTYGGEVPFPDDEAGRAAYREKVDWSARRLADLDADVIGFQELWAAAALDDVLGAAGMADAYDVVARDAPGPGRPQVALAVRRADGASRLAPGADWIPDFPDSFRFDGLRESDGAEEEITVTIGAFSRPVLSAVVRLANAPEIRVLVAHLKSKGPAWLAFPDPLPPVLRDHRDIAKTAVSHIRRVMEAGALRALLDDVMAEAPSPTVLLGDLNDDTGAITTELITDRPGYRPYASSRRGNRSNRGLYSVERLQQLRSLRNVYYTYLFEGKRESLDHILVSEAFYDHATRRLWSFREMEVLNDHLGRETARSVGASDHGLVRAAFDWNPAG